jgi:aromatic-L-amino-acid decarboxylase
MESLESPAARLAPLDISPEEFRALGHRLVDRLAEFLAAFPEGPVSPGEAAPAVRAALRAEQQLPLQGCDPQRLLDEATDLLLEHSLFNGHPRFCGFITASAAPIGMLGELLAAAVNPNVGAWTLSPLASDIEAQTVRWIAELLGYPTECGGLLVSGGNMANFVGFLAARRAQAAWNVRAAGMAGDGARRLRVYASKETHTWLQKAADMFGLGTESIRWVPTDGQLRMDTGALRRQIDADRRQGDQPFLVVGTAGSVSTGAIDPLVELAAVCREQGLWFHVDGAYGGFATVVPDVSADLRALALADSVAVDPHKWLYAPLEAGCALVRDPARLRDAFSYRPPYYAFGAESINFVDFGPQNSRGFRALKVWLALRQVGREGYGRMIADDMALSRQLFASVSACAGLQAFTQGLSIATFRFVPPDLRPGEPSVDTYLDELNRELLVRLEQGGEVYLSNAVVNGTFLLRACIVNFRTSERDVQAIPAIVVRAGRLLDQEMRPAVLRR